MNINKWIQQKTSDLTGKTIAITGSTGKIMTEVIVLYASLNANFIFINRNRQKTQKQIDDLKQQFPNIKIKFYQCDLSKFQEVKIVTKKLKSEKIDILYLAAGVYNIKRYKTELGFDNIFQTNFVSHYYITKELIQNIKAVNGKIVAVSSIAHNYSKMNEEDIDFSLSKKHSKVYGNAKRFLTYSLQEFAKKENFNLSVVHPGLTLTNMTNHYNWSVNWLVKIFIGIFCPSVKKSSLPLVKGVFENTNYHEWIGPSFINVYGYPKVQKLKKITEKESKQIFKISEEIYSKIKE